MGLLSLSYRRPAYVENRGNIGTQPSPETVSGDRNGDSLNPVTSSGSIGIPSALSFDRILGGETCPPCTLRDFMNYLIYIERSAENLQFFLWYREYVRRFNEAKTADLALAPEWTQAMEDEAAARIKKDHAEKARNPPKVEADIFKGTDFDKRSSAHNTLTPPHSPLDLDYPDFETPKTKSSHRTKAAQAFASVGVKAPFTIQPFRRELDCVIAAYLTPDSPRQLNLSDGERRAALHALAFTTHPSALRAVAASVEATLRMQAHPNFIRWSIGNGNPPRVAFAMGLGVAVVLISMVVGVVLVLAGGVGRGWRALVAIGWLVGFATIMGAYKGMCLVLHGLHLRNLRPWEMFISDPRDDDSTSSIKAGNRSFNTFGTTNSYEDEPWVVRYSKRSVIRKIFDRQVSVEEPALRQIQDTIFVQSLLFGLVCAAVLTAIFVAVPGGAVF